MTVNVVSWWYFLCAIAALNILAWSISAIKLQPHRRGQLLLSGVYVFGCAFRSVFPVYDVPRLCLSDHWLSSVVVGRSVATLAELCFVAQWALMLNTLSSRTGSTLARVISFALVPLIAVAELCSWYSVLTTSNLGHVAEESIWGTAVALLVAGGLALYPRCSAGRRPMIAAWCAAGIVYVAFMFWIDVPMYWSRFIADQASGRHYMSIVAGMLDVSTRRRVSYRWEDWRSEMLWMSLYFSIAVWISISLIRAPVPEGRSPAGMPERPRAARSLWFPSLAKRRV